MTTATRRHDTTSIRKRASPSTSASRLLSVDVARGITIAFMIMVNNNGGEEAWGFMKHAEWNGLTATDLVFPTFVFVMGTAVLAIESRRARGVPPSSASSASSSTASRFSS